MLNKERLENLSDDIWKGAIKLRGKFKAKDYPSVILPMIMLRRIECVLIDIRKNIAEILKKLYPKLSEKELKNRVKIDEKTKHFYNKSHCTLAEICIIINLYFVYLIDQCWYQLN